MITLYGISNCDTIKKARNWLQSNNLEYEFHDYKKLGCDQKLAKLFLAKFGLETAINRRGTSWRKLPDKIKQEIDSASAVGLMSENPSLIKRPIVATAESWLIGFDAQEWADKLL